MPLKYMTCMQYSLQPAEGVGSTGTAVKRGLVDVGNQIKPMASARAARTLSCGIISLAPLLYLNVPLAFFSP